MLFKRRDKRPLLRWVRESVVPRRGWRRALEYLSHRVRRLPDTPHRIALGFACGVFSSFTPFFGLHFVMAGGLAWLVRGNIIGSLLGTLVGNPLTLPLIASVSLALGRRILGFGATGRDFDRVAEAFLAAFEGLWRTFLSLFGIGHSEWPKLVQFWSDVVLPYFVGGILPGLVAAIASYYLIRPLVAAYQIRRRSRMLERARKRVHQAKSAADASRPAPYTGE